MKSRPTLSNFARGVALAGALSIALSPRSADACSPMTNAPFEVDARLPATDTTAPGAVSATVERVIPPLGN